LIVRSVARLAPHKVSRAPAGPDHRLAEGTQLYDWQRLG